MTLSSRMYAALSVVLTVVIIMSLCLSASRRCCLDCICPGVGVGKIRLGMSEDSVTDVIGVPEKRVGDAGGLFYLAFPRRGLLVAGNKEAGVTSISVFASGSAMLDVYKGKVEPYTGKFHSIVGIGSSRKEVERYMGGAVVDSEGVFNVAYSGISIFYDQADAVSLIQVHQKSD